MEEDLGKEGIELKAKKPRSQKQIDAFETARAIRMENAKLKKEGISKVKEDVKNRNKSTLPKVSTTQSGLMEQIEPKPKESVAKPLPKLKESVAKPLPSEVLSEDVKSGSDEPLEPEVIIVKKKKKPKVIYVEGSSDDEPEPIKVKKEKVKSDQGQSHDLRQVEQIIKEPLVIIQPIKPSIRFC